MTFDRCITVIRAVTDVGVALRLNDLMHRDGPGCHSLARSIKDPKTNQARPSPTDHKRKTRCDISEIAHASWMYGQ